MGRPADCCPTCEQLEKKMTDARYLFAYNKTAMNQHDGRWPGTLSAFFSAVLFGMSAPFGKLLLSHVKPLPLAALLYLGSFAGITAIALVRALLKGRGAAEAPLRRGDLFALACAILSGGVVAPILLFYGLSRTPASVASLLLNTEAMLTMLLAALVFREWVGKQVWVSAALMLCASLIMVYSSVEKAAPSGPLLIVAACFMWGVDNNITRRLSHKSPFSIAQIKGLVAGIVTLLIAYSAGDSLPAAPFILSALLLGAFSYGASLVLFIYALRYIGTSRTATWFQTAPFIGAIVSFLLLGEPLSARLAVSGFIMIGAAALLLREYHAHEHKHPATLHEHRHEHDEHHQHEHENAPVGAHAHLHQHAPVVHSHTHFPDTHHRHKH
jgi:drug/metabolite transporter (DMT)-like permease